MSDVNSTENVLTCPACQGQVDATGIEIGSIITCPHCNHEYPVTRQFGNFLLEALVGSGGMGAVYRGKDLLLKRTVAIKVLKGALGTDQKFITTFLHEAKITASLNHPNIVQVYAFGEHQGQYYLVMEHIGGGSLDERINKFGGVTELEGIEIAIAVASGLKFAQDRGLIHRDIKPGNILFGANNTPKVVDFGLSLSKEVQDNFEGEIWGTPYYVPPEKLEGFSEDFRSDLYSLGTTLFHAFTGRPPYDDKDPNQVAMKHLQGSKISIKTFVPQASDQTAFTVAKAMARYPEDRFQSYDEFISQMEDAKRRLMNASTGLIKPKPVTLVPNEAAETKSVWLVVTVIILVLMLITATITFKDLLFGPKESQELIEYGSPAQQKKKAEN